MGMFSWLKFGKKKEMMSEAPPASPPMDSPGAMAGAPTKAAKATQAPSMSSDAVVRKTPAKPAAKKAAPKKKK